MTSNLFLAVLLSGPAVAAAQTTEDSLHRSRRDTTVRLQQVEVTGRTAKKYTSDYSFSATKIATANKDIPQSISTITKELITDRQAIRAGDVIKYVSGVSPVSFYSHYAIRGLTRNEETRIYNGMRTSQYLFNQPLTFNVERIEVIKGPASATISNADPGGAVNIVTKKPLAENRKQASLSIGSFNTYVAALDFTGPLNKDKTLLYRLNVGYEDAQSFRDLIYRKAWMIAPSFSYLIGDKTRMNVEIVVNRDQSRLDRGQPIFGAIAGKTSLHSTPVSFSMSMPNDHNIQNDLKFFASLSHRFSDKITFNLSYLKQVWHEDLFEHRTSNEFAVDSAGKPVSSLAAMQVYERLQKWATNNVNAYLNIQLATGPVTHEIVAGYDYVDLTKPRGNTQNTAKGFRSADNSAAINNYVPGTPGVYQYTTIKGIRVPVPNVPYFDLENPRYEIRNSSDFIFSREEFAPSHYNVHAVYLQEQARMGRWLLTAGLRQEWYQDVMNHKLTQEQRLTQQKLIGRAGLTYKATDNINAYIAYVQGYNPQTAASILQFNAGGPFDPMTTELKEAGVKTSWLDGTLNISAAMYHIHSKNILVNTGLALPVYAQRGAETSRGVEVDIAGNMLPNWQISAAYAYTDAFVSDDIKAGNIGLRKENTPWHSGNIWTRYDCRIPALKGLGIGAGVQYRGERLPWLNRNAFVIPAYTLVDAALYYRVKQVQLALNMNNVLNSTYWVGAYSFFQLFPGAPRNIMLNVTYHF